MPLAAVPPHNSGCCGTSWTLREVSAKASPGDAATAYASGEKVLGQATTPWHADYPGATFLTRKPWDWFRGASLRVQRSV